MPRVRRPLTTPDQRDVAKRKACRLNDFMVTPEPTIVEVVEQETY